MAITAAQFPVREPVVGADRIVSEPWRIWFRNLLVTQQNQPVVTTPLVSLIGKTASVPITAFATGTLSAGFYRVSYYITCTTAAGVSSSFSVTANWTDHGVAQSRASANMTGNTTATNQSEVWPIHIDASSPVSYTLTYASNPAGVAVFNGYLTLETVAAA